MSWDASSYDEICVNCGATDQVPGGWGKLAEPCSKPVGSGGITIEEYNKKEQERVTALRQREFRLGSAS